MIYLYDNAICEDLKKSFNPQNVPNPVVKVVDPEHLSSIAAQLQEDQIQFPIVAVDREFKGIDKNRMNFTALHRGIVSVLDPKTNLLYYEKSIPINIDYHLTVLTTNTADMDELVKELLFKYVSMYFLTIKLPYECDRKVRFGLAVDTDKAIDVESGSSEYLKEGKVYQSIIHLNCHGCVLVHYTPAKLHRTMVEAEANLQQQYNDTISKM